MSLLVDALDEPAAGFYRSFCLAASPDKPLLFLSVAVVAK